MASSQPSLLEIDQRFCQCPICLQQYTEPKLLPCIHRYCRNCLEQLLERNQDTNKMKCPECREEFEIPREGVDGFKTDFYIKNVIEYIHLQKSLEDEQLRECCDCAKKIKVTAYCFKCNDFLCEECHHSHVTKKMLKDHKQHTLSLGDIKSKNMTLEKLVALKEAPRCQHHPENLSQLCCKTCNNLPICLTCTYGSHENHKIKDVNILATEEKQRLKERLEMLNQYKVRLCKISKTVNRVKQELVGNVQKKKEFYQTRYEKDLKKLEAKMTNTEDNTRIQETEIEAKKERDLNEIQKQMEKELEKVRISDRIRKENEAKLSDFRQTRDEQLQKNKQKLGNMETELQNLMISIGIRQGVLEKQLEEISLHIDGTAKRFENLIATAHSILDAGNDWTAVQCIPDIRLASEPLSKEMRREFPELQMMSQIEISVEVTLNALSPIEIEGIKAKDSTIDSITRSGDGNVVITGCTSKNRCSHITAVSMEGKMLHQKKMRGSCPTPHRFCEHLSQFKVTTVCWKDEIALYDVRHGSCVAKNIRDITYSWKENWLVRCVAFDATNNHIFVGGCYSRNVYVFDDHLNFLRILTLPEMIKDPYDMKVSDGTLLVCDYAGCGAYAVSIEGLDSKLLHEFSKPIIDGDDWGPIGVCFDTNGLVYMLWKGWVSGEKRCLLVQYSKDGRQLLTPVPVDNDAICVTTVETTQTERLIIATEKSGKLYIYDLGSPCVLL